MYLKAVYIEGFKSFAKKTKIEFNKDITAIVGPNGSGKSNITDAIMWVLGESSAKNLRGQKMEDIIFSGTDNMRPLGLAQVTIVFDNSDKSLLSDYTEVSVTRKMYRSLESEFLINNVKCRLKDIKELFMDTGIGKDGYSLIGQGRIDSILSNKAEDRRSIFEEAAGISKYKFKKKESQNKLQRAKDNLTRLSDIISEIENQEGTLKIQMLKAKRYLKIFNELKEKDINFVYFNNQKLQVDLKNLSEEYNQIITKINSIENQISSLNIEEEELEKNLELTEVRIDKNQELINTNNLTKQKNSSNIEILKEKISSLQLTIKNLLSDAQKDKEKIENNNESINKNTETLKLNEDKLSELNIIIEENKNKLDILKKEIDSQEKFEDSKRKTELELENQIKNLTFKNQTLENFLEDKKQRSQILKNNISNFSENQIELIDSLKVNEEKLKTSQDKLKAKLKESDEITSNLSKLNGEFQSQSKNIEDLNFKSKDILNRLNFLKSLSENYDGYNRSVKSFMNYTNKINLFKNKILGSVGDNIYFEKKYQKAISVALGGSLQNIIVEKLTDVSPMIELLQKEKFGRITFMPLDNIKNNNSNLNLNPYKNMGAIDFAINLISFQDKFYNIYSNLLGKIIVCDNFTNASKLQKTLNNKFRIVTLDGDIFNTTGSITGGYVNKSNLDLISRKNDLKEKKEQFDDINLKIQSQSEKLENLSKNLDKYKILEQDNKKEINELEQIINSLKISIENIKNSKLNNEEYLSRYNSELDDIYKSLASDELEIENNKKKLEEVNTSLSSLSLSKNDFSNNLLDKKSELESLREEFQENILNRREIEEKNNYLKIEIKRLTDEIKVLDEAINSSYERENNLKNEITINEESIATFESDLIENENSSSCNIEIDKTLREEKTNLSLKLKEIRENKDKIKEELIDLNNLREKNRSKVERKEEILNDSLRRIEEEYNLTSVNEAVNKDLGRISEKEIKKLKKDLQDLGPVNLNSIGEYELIKERLEMNLKQRQDLLNSGEEIENILRDLDKEMKEIFKKSFAEISKNFNEIFKILFDGGKAEIELTGEILDGGIEIKAMPPGKRLQSLSLLSGGEKALTAVALLFALLKVRPAPFCILDEIDAALDDANIKKYCDYLKTLENIQFIMITHRKLTMEIAGTMYGVTMEEKGVSKLYSVKLQ
ncbi:MULTISPECIES: chromosome segregation protein SMC [Peptoniphilus]|uniref:chromosome segregation protein SMC n=1 Tax=Peptoniphilus TaxID=162289 RepID=UPI0001DC9EA6|nr:chromosome segregation protein SMC [Peptoniphilus sp. oral taxon 836]EFK38633.1 chromosome segregation protein SMC [Peptoniphilus sp. oral taxon 836 str. F0141]